MQKWSLPCKISPLHCRRYQALAVLQLSGIIRQATGSINNIAYNKINKFLESAKRMASGLQIKMRRLRSKSRRWRRNVLLRFGLVELLVQLAKIDLR
jgi:hypothetical protein